MGSLARLRWLDLGSNDLTGPIPAALGNLANLGALSLARNALTGPVPAWLGNLVQLRRLDLSWNDLAGPIPPALERADRPRAAVAGEPDRAPGAGPYAGTGDGRVDILRLADSSDDHLDEVHDLRDRVGADLVHLIVAEAADICGMALRPGAFSLTPHGCGGR